MAALLLKTARYREPSAQTPSIRVSSTSDPPTSKYNFPAFRSAATQTPVWSAHLAAMMFSVVQTVLLWGLNPHHWLRAFLQACADHGGQSPEDLSPFLPWQMTPERREELARPVLLTPLPVASAPKELLCWGNR